MLDRDLQLPWTQPAWFEQASAWIHMELERQDLRVTGPIELLHMRPWSSLARVPTKGGAVFFKAASPTLIHEPALTQALARWRPDCMLTILAADFDRGWILSADAGVTLRSLIKSPNDLGHWDKVLPLYAELQIDLAGRVPELLALGTPDRRLAVLPRLYEQLLEGTENLRVGLSEGLTHEEHQRLRDLRPRFSALCERLAGYGIPETIAHEEIHDANIIVAHDRYIFVDWGESSVAHPFFTMPVTLRMVSYRLKLREDRPEVVRLSNIYLEPWTQFGSREKLVAALRLAYRLGMVNRALSWCRVLAPLPAQHKEPHADAVSGWLQNFLEAEAKADD